MSSPDDMIPGEQSRLVELEKVIDHGQRSFIEVGRALLEIRDRRLYRQTHATFDAYCESRWDFERARACQLIGAAEVVDNLSTTVNTLPQNERQARALGRIKDVGEQAIVWRKAIATAPGGVITSTELEVIVRDHITNGVEPATGRGIECICAFLRDRLTIDEIKEKLKAANPRHGSKGRSCSDPYLSFPQCYLAQMSEHAQLLLLWKLVPLVQQTLVGECLEYAYECGDVASELTSTRRRLRH